MKTLVRTIYFKILNWISILIFKLNKVQYVSLNSRGIPLLICNGITTIGGNCTINSSSYKNIIGGDTRSSIVVKKRATLTIGDNFKMSNSAIYCADQITIGNNVMIGGSCKIWDTDFHPLNSDERNENPNDGYQTAPITIGNNVFIGGCTIILKGVSIGDHSIVGAGSVVTKNIPSGEVWAGNPAKFIKIVRND